MWALISVLPFVGISIVASVFLGNVWIGQSAAPAEGDKPAQLEEKGKVMYGMYVTALFLGTVEMEKRNLDVNMEQEDEMKRARVEDIEMSGGVTPPQTAHVGVRV